VTPARPRRLPHPKFYDLQKWEQSQARRKALKAHKAAIKGSKKDKVRCRRAQRARPTRRGEGGPRQGERAGRGARRACPANASAALLRLSRGRRADGLTNLPPPRAAEGH